MSRQTISDFKQSFNLVDYVMSTEALSRQYRAGVFILCPFHQDRNPSLFVEYDSWRCYGCGQYGDSIDFLVKTGVAGSIGDAIHGQFSRFCDSSPSARQRPEKRYVRPNPRILRRMHQDLMISPEKRQLLLDRGIFLESMIKYQIGYGIMPWSKSKSPRFSIPFFGEDGIAITAKFRRDDTVAGSDEYKYVSWPGTMPYLFNVDRVGSSQSLLYCGGQFDSIVWDQVGVNAVGPASETMFRDEWSKVFEDKDVTILLDNDEAGRLWSRKVQEKIPWARVAEWPKTIPEGYDASDVFMKIPNGSDVLMEIASA